MTTSKVARLIVALCLISLLTVPMMACAKPLTLTVWEPNDGAILTSSQIYVKGKVSNPKATVTVNNINPWKNRTTGEFQGTVSLTEGENTIEIVAKQGKKVATKTLTITYRPEQQPEQEGEK